MDIRIQIPDNKLASFTASSKEELSSKMAGIADAIVDEATRIERSERGDGTQGEVVRNDVVKAASLFTRHIDHRRAKKVFAVCEVGSTVSGLLAGIMIPMYESNVLYMISGIFFLVISVILSFYLIFFKD